MQAEIDFWTKNKEGLKGDLPGNLAGLPQQAQLVIDNLNAWEDAASAETPAPNISQIEQSFRQSLSGLTNWMAKNWLYRGTPFVEAMLSAHRFAPEAGNAFLDAIINKRVNFPNHQPPTNVFVGAILAYEYLLQDESQLAKRRNAEKRAFSTLRADLEKERNRLVSEIEDFRNGTDSWRSDAQGEFKGWFDRIQTDSGKWFTFVKERSRGFG